MSLIDCRPQQDYIDGHLYGAVSIPWMELGERLYEMPSKSQPLRLVGDTASLDVSITFLTKKGYHIAETIVLNSSILAQLKQKGQLEQGLSLHYAWQACPLVQRWPELAKKWQIAPGKGLDLACGTGRDAVFLAMHGWQMTAVDYLPRALNKTADLAKRYHVDLSVQAMDIEQEDLSVFEQQFDLLLVARYLHRPLLAKLSQLLKPSGVLLYQTFMQDAKRWGSPKNARYLLAEGELARHFSQLNILRDSVDYLADGRPVSSFVAQKPHP